MKKFVKFLEENYAWENFERAFRNYHGDVKKIQKSMQKRH